jgi:hypothetical protein
MAFSPKGAILLRIVQASSICKTLESCNDSYPIILKKKKKKKKKGGA